MKVRVVLFCFLFILAGCGAVNEVTNEDVKDYKVKQTFDETVEDTFVFQLVSAKEEYEAGEKIELYGEITYTGKGEIKITHASSAILFEIKEQVRDYVVPFAVQEIGIETELAGGEAYREKYLKQGVFSFELEDEQHVEFIEDFKDRCDFPPGYYTVKATTSFHDSKILRELETAVDFKVWAENEER
ncbi:hypothetical protein [Oceanobacillus alkalisoli]|uniref:hypothetical protein n=1 Tax=Oceanobacillus alkalisoli TaxID=2925113 RepID=UPI001F1223A4|nr:hypothetical protein [Oceanobacillus alkalisoli]MCF3944850.1 hypothetical protein [Oceanobacillus alkalisoli]